MPRWQVRLGLSDRAGEPHPYDGFDDDGSSTMRVANGTVWIGIGSTPGEALAHAQRARARAMPDVEKCLGRLRSTLAGAFAQRRTAQPVVIEPGLVMATTSLLGERVPGDPKEWTEPMVQDWVAQLEAVLAVEDLEG